MGPTTPVPLSETVCGLPAASSLTVREADSAPCDRGRNSTEMVQEEPTASVEGEIGQVLADSTKFDPTAMEEIVNGSDSLLVTVTVLAPLVTPIWVLYQLSVEGEKVTAWASAWGESITPQSITRANETAGKAIRRAWCKRWLMTVTTSVNFCSALHSFYCANSTGSGLTGSGRPPSLFFFPDVSMYEVK